MPFFMCFEGIDYAGKTTLISQLKNHVDIETAPRVTPGWEIREEMIHGNQIHNERFVFFIQEIQARSKFFIEKFSNTTSIVALDRHVYSILAYHNIIQNEKLEERIDFSKILEPDLTVLVCVEESDLIERLRNRPPKHKYEADVKFLLDVQTEYQRLLSKSEDVIIVNSSLQPLEALTNQIVDYIRSTNVISIN